MSGALQRSARWRGLAGAVVGVSALFAAVLTYAIFALPSADPPDLPVTTVRLIATWLVFTLLLSLMFAAGIWRMTGSAAASGSAMSPRVALAILASTIAICSFGAFAYFLLKQGG
jgi:hypothetical protein